MYSSATERMKAKPRKAGWWRTRHFFGQNESSVGYEIRIQSKDARGSSSSCEPICKDATMRTDVRAERTLYGNCSYLVLAQEESENRRRTNVEGEYGFVFE